MDATQRIHDIASRNDLPTALPGALSLGGYASYWHQDDGSTDEITGPALCANLDDARATGHLYGQPHTAGEMIMARTIAMHEPRITAIWHTAMFPNLPGNGILLGQGADGVMRAWICSIHECDSCNHCLLNQVTDNLFVRSIRNHGFLLDEGTNNAYRRVGGRARRVPPDHGPTQPVARHALGDRMVVRGVRPARAHQSVPPIAPRCGRDRHGRPGHVVEAGGTDPFHGQTHTPMGHLHAVGAHRLTCPIAVQGNATPCSGVAFCMFDA